MTQSHVDSYSPPVSLQDKGQSPYLLLFIILVLAAVATWIIPAGVYDYETRDGIKFAVKGSLHAVAQSGVYPLEIFTAIAKGMVKQASIIFLILFTGGVLAVIFGLLGTTGVVVNAVVAFVPIGLLIARSMGLPPILGASLVYLTCAAGFNVAILNPATTGLTQHLAQLPLFSGMLLRGITCLLFIITAAAYLIWSIRRSRQQGSVRPTLEASGNEVLNVTGRHKWVLAITVLALILFIAGTIQFHWGTNEMSAMFILLTIIVGLIGRLSGSEIANTFLAGCSKLVKGAFIVGMAAAISLVLQQGNVLDPIVGSLSNLLEPVPIHAATLGMFISAALIHFGISSGSGESALLIPIFSPLGDNLGLTRQVMVQAVLLGEGIVNCMNPTSGVLMAVLATAGVPYGKWLRFVAPVIAIWFVICVIMLLIGVAINWGPF